jgi:hypothetical protein
VRNFVIAGQSAKRVLVPDDPAIHLEKHFAKMMDTRVKPACDG